VGVDNSGRQHDDPKWTGPQPILLDLDGTGVEITELSRSTRFMDAGGEGLLHRTAWAAAGNGVLFFDPDGRNAITEKRQYVFTEWDPTARGDKEALRSVFDQNGDGRLTAAHAGRGGGAQRCAVADVDSAEAGDGLLGRCDAGGVRGCGISVGLPDSRECLPSGSRRVCVGFLSRHGGRRRRG
jgi:hypothetical protein